MAAAVKPFTFSNGTTADATEVNANFDTLYTLVNGNLDQANLANNAVGTSEIADNAVTTAKIANDQITSDKIADNQVQEEHINWGTEASQVSAEDMPIADGEGLFSTDDVESALRDLASGAVLPPTAPPIGSIIAFYDFNGAATFDNTKWSYCNGSVQTLGGGIGSQTLPDLSNRYLVGFGTEAGGDIGSATWATAAVGLANHQANLQHSHTVASHTHTTPAHAHTLSNHTHTGGAHTHSTPNHTHTLSNHTHTGGAHTHGLSANGYALIEVQTSPDEEAFMKTVSASWTADQTMIGGNGTTVGSTSRSTATELGGDTDSAGAVSTGGPSTDSTDSSGGGTTGSGGAVATGGPSVNSTDTSGSGTSGTASPGTDNQLSTTQSIQPRSVQVRWIMRIN